jgi:NAD(P)H-dependent FMN reductase
MKQLLVVYHTQFGGTAQMAEAACAGARSIDGVTTVFMRAADAGVPDLLAADALLIATSENFGGMAGLVKDFLERVYYPCEGKLAGRAYSVLVCAGNDGSGAMLQVDRVARGLALRKVLPGVTYRSGRIAQPHALPEPVRAECRELGATLAAGLAAGIY